MTTKHMSHVVTTGPAVQAQVLYHWLTYVNSFIVVEAHGANWTSTDFSGSTGAINSLTPLSFYDANPVFDATFVGKYIAIKDGTNPRNSTVAKIANFVSATEIVLETASLFDTDSSDLSYVVFDTVASPISTGDFLVLQTPISSGLQWQIRCELTATPELKWTMGFLGGWNVGTSTWDLPQVSSDFFSSPTTYYTYCVADDAAGYFYMWTDSTNVGSLAPKNAMWAGNLSPFHSPVEPGVPKDLSYSAIFGSTTSLTTANVSRDTSVANNFSVGETVGASGLVIPLYFAQKALLSSGVDTMSHAITTNPRSGQIDDYDAICFSPPPDLGWRGRVLGVRLLNDNVANRTPINSNDTYVVGGGIGASWNGKAPNP